jgi:hypothetical protein
VRLVGLKGARLGRSPLLSLTAQSCCWRPTACLRPVVTAAAVQSNAVAGTRACAGASTRRNGSEPPRLRPQFSSGTGFVPYTLSLVSRCIVVLMLQLRQLACAIQVYGAVVPCTSVPSGPAWAVWHFRTGAGPGLLVIRWGTVLHVYPCNVQWRWSWHY